MKILCYETTLLQLPFLYLVQYQSSTLYMASSIPCSFHPSLFFTIQTVLCLLSSRYLTHSKFCQLLSSVSPHCTFWMISDAQLPDTLRVVHTNLAQASQFWTFWYRDLARAPGSRTMVTRRHTVSVDETTTPYFLPTAGDRERGKMGYHYSCQGDFTKFHNTWNAWLKAPASIKNLC